MIKFSKKLLSKKREFKISNHSLSLLKKAGVKSIFYGGHGYACVYVPSLKRRSGIQLHRFLMKLIGCDIDGLEIDHINGNRLDNRISNLRMATDAQNASNRKIPVNNSSGFKGVHFQKNNKNWVARIGIGKKRKHLGAFKTKEDAAKAYNAAAKEKYGEFAKLNSLNACS